MKIWLIILAVLGTACGTAIDEKVNNYPKKYLDPQLREVVEYWVSELAQRALPQGAIESAGGAEIRVLRFVPDGTVKGGGAGNCGRKAQFKGLGVWERTFATIDIEEKYRTAPLPDLRIIVGHELGHCWFGFNHSDEAGQLMSEHPPLGGWNIDWFEQMKLEFLDQIENTVGR